MKKQLLMGTLAAAVMAGVTAPAMAEGLGASAGVASAYLWRGLDLGDGSPAVWGDINYKASGAYAGAWVSSGDSTLGSEYDLYVGYGTEVGGLGIDLSLWNYNYPDKGLDSAAAFGTNDSTIGDLSEVVLALSMSGATFKYYDNVAGGTGYEYYTLSYGMNGITGLVGYHDFEADDSDMTHFDLSYAFNENVTFTFSKILDEEEEGDFDSDGQFVVSYSLPIK